MGEGGVKDMRWKRESIRRPIGVIGELEWVDSVRDGEADGIITTEHCMSSIYATSHFYDIS